MKIARTPESTLKRFESLGRQTRPVTRPRHAAPRRCARARRSTGLVMIHMIHRKRSTWDWRAFRKGLSKSILVTFGASGTRRALVPNQWLLLLLSVVHLVPAGAATAPGLTPQPPGVVSARGETGRTYEAGDLRSEDLYDDMSEGYYYYYPRRQPPCSCCSRC